MRNHVLAGLLTIGLLICVTNAGAEEWPQWRGPHLDGSSEAKGLPDKLDASTQAWAVDLPGTGNGTPIVWQDRIFISCLDPKSSKLLAVCLSRKDGSVLWSKQVGLGYQKNDRNDTASPSPVTDGKMVWFYFGTGDLAAFDMDGNEKWSRNLQKQYGPFNIQWIYASSPLLDDGKIYVQVLQRDVPPRRGAAASGTPADSYLLAMDATTGKDLWRQIRPNDAVGESKESYATPIPFTHDGHTEILLVGGDCVTAHDPQTGKELWRCGGWNPQKINHWRIGASVVAADDLVFACPPKGGAMFAVKDGGNGDVTGTNVAWKNPELTSDAAVPLIYKDHLYVLNGDRPRTTLYCAEPKTGKVLWSIATGSRSVLRASPTGADNKIYLESEAGDVWVISADEAKILSKSSLGGRSNHATIAAVDGGVFARVGDSGNKLYAFK
ncbi:MAG TPA: PQQ-binding-like beta-propeller repeat protein [Tepidisphaeraceae bacterium]